MPPSRPRPSRPPHLLAALGLAAVVVLAYGNSFRAELTLDNAYLIRSDPRVHDATWENLRLIFSQDYWASQSVTGVYRPLTTLSFLVDYAVLGHGEDPAGYHATNLVLHWANAVLVWLLALAVLGRARLAFCTAAVFAAHPLATESVTNIIGRADLLATLAVLGGLLCYLAAVRREGSARWWWLGAVALALAAGLLAKESAVALIGVMLVADLHRIEDRSLPGLARGLVRALRRDYLAVVPPLLLVWWVRARVYRGVEIRDIPFLENPLVGADFWTARLTALKVLGRYAALLVWPARLSCDYSFDAIPLVDWHSRRWADVQALVALAGLGAALALAVRLRTRDRAAFFFLAFFVVTILPVSNLIVPFGTIMAERLTYLPSVGFAGCLVLGVDAVCRRLRRARAETLAGAVLAAMVVAYGVRTLVRNLDWRTNLTLFESAVQTVPGSYKAHMGLAAELAGASDDDAQRIDRIVAEGERALAIIERAGLPDSKRPLVPPLALAGYYKTKATTVPDEAARSEWYEKAETVLQRAASDGRAKLDEMRARGWAADRVEVVRARGQTAKLFLELGDARMRLHAYEPAARAFAETTQLTPQDPKAFLSLGFAQAGAGELDDSAVTLIQTLALDDGQTDGWDLLERVYATLERPGCGIRRETGRPRLDPGCPDVCPAYAGLVRLLRTGGDDARAAQIAERARLAYQCPAAPGGER